MSTREKNSSSIEPLPTLDKMHVSYLWLGKLFFTISGIILMTLGFNSLLLLFKVPHYIVENGYFFYMIWFAAVIILFSIPLIWLGLTSIGRAKSQSLSIFELIIMIFFTSVLVISAIKVEFGLDNLSFIRYKQINEVLIKNLHTKK